MKELGKNDKKYRYKYLRINIISMYYTYTQKAIE